MTSIFRLPLALAALLLTGITCSDYDYQRLHYSGSTVNKGGEDAPVDMEYLLYTRDGKTEGLPLIVFLHGAGGHRIGGEAAARWAAVPSSVRRSDETESWCDR